MLMVPTMFWPLAKSRLISLRGKLRMGMEVIIPRRKEAGDESLGRFVTRRLGRECLGEDRRTARGRHPHLEPREHERNGNIPALRADGAKSGSLILGMLAALKSRPHATLSGPSRPPA